MLEGTQDEVEAIEEQLLKVTDENDVQQSLEEVLYPDNTDYYVDIRQDGKVVAQVGDEEELDPKDEMNVP
ncbi:hypothetical protein R0J91_22770, partial [Micrococcus sp. SIMBA_131]